MVYKYFWPWDNPWTGCRSWVITSSIPKALEHPQHLMLNNSQPGFYKGPLLRSEQTNPGRKAAFSPQSPDPWGVPSQEGPGSEWHGTQGACDSAWGPHTPRPKSRPEVPSLKDAGLALTLMASSPPTLETLCPGAQSVLCPSQSVVSLILFKKNYPNSYHLESMTVGIKRTLLFQAFSLHRKCVCVRGEGWIDGFTQRKDLLKLDCTRCTLIVLKLEKGTEIKHKVLLLFK